MTRNVITVFSHTSLRYVAKLMSQHHISGIPVVDDNHHVIGMVSENDLLAWRDEPSEKQAWWLNMLAEGFELSPDFLDVIRSEREKVRGVMKTVIVTVPEDMLVKDVAKLIIEKSVKRVPVLRDGVLVGVVSRADLVRALAKE